MKKIIFILLLTTYHLPLTSVSLDLGYSDFYKELDQSKRYEEKRVELTSEQISDAVMLKESLRGEAFSSNRRIQATSQIAQEGKSAEYELGKVLTDINGYRVRLEEYLLRPQPDQLNLLAITTRIVNNIQTLNKFSILATFNKILPDDVSFIFNLKFASFMTALDLSEPKIIEANLYYVVRGETEFSSGNNKFTHIYDKPVVETYDKDGFKAYIVRKYNEDSLYVNNIIKEKYVDNGLKKEGYNDENWYAVDQNGVLQLYATRIDKNSIQSVGPGSFITPKISGTVVDSNNKWPSKIWANNIPLFSNSKNTLRIEWADGTWLESINYTIDNDGQLFYGDAWPLEPPFNINYETIITASDFGANNINTIVTPFKLHSNGRGLDVESPYHDIPNDSDISYSSFAFGYWGWW